MSGKFFCMVLAFSFVVSQRAHSEEVMFAGHKVAVMIDPVYLVLPAVHITAEFRTSESSGMAGRAMYGSVLGFPSYLLGAQFNYYLVGHFNHGMQLGGQLVYEHLSTSSSSSISASGNGVFIGPYLGYKVAAGFGLTFNIQAGVAYLISSASATDGTSSATASASGLAFTENINFGWSF